VESEGQQNKNVPKKKISEMAFKNMLEKRENMTFPQKTVDSILNHWMAKINKYA